jgi:hypothetical protein
VQVGFSLKGSECFVKTDVPQGQDPSYRQYEIDGKYRGRVRLRNGRDTVRLHAGNGTHSAWIYKATEATTGPVFIRSVTGRKMRALARPEDLPVIEFIGNSITCGAAADASEVPCSAGRYSDQHNAYLAYGPQVARALGVNYFLSSVSGIGIYRTWNAEAPSMPLVYGKARLREGDREAWDFSRYHPAILSIALGTNDLSEGDGISPRVPFDSARFVADYTAFVGTVHRRYPKARIVLLGSHMVSGARRALLERCLARVKKEADPMLPSGNALSLFYFPPMQAHGCTGHPDIAGHTRMAQLLEPFLGKLLHD